jgi:carbon monoxide dehydrogenase subunit G
MAVELDHSFSTAKSIDDSFAAIVDLERVVPAVEGGRVIETTGPDSVKAEIVLKMGAMSMSKAASMGEGVMVGALDAMIKDFTQKLGQV